MFNVAVFNLKDIIKNIIGIILIIGIIVLGTKIINKDNTTKIINDNTLNKDLSQCMGETFHAMASINEEEAKYKEEDIEDINYLEEFLHKELSVINVVNNIELDAEVVNIENNNSNETNSNITLEKAPTGVTTEVVTNNPLKLTYNTEYGSVKIKNETSYELTPEILNPDITIDNKNIVLFHTHTCESYTSSEKYQYTPTGTFRTTDLNFSVARVGTELENQLKQYNYNVIHDITYHDYPSYNGSYTRSLETVQNILKNNPSDIVWDVHRDAIGSRSDYAPTVKIGDDYAAQIMFVIGTNEGGLWHPNWNQNLKFAVKVQQKAEEMYPGLFKPMLVTKSRYNQHSAKYAGIIEVGATGNTMEQCLTSMKYLAKVMDEVLK